MSKKVRRGEKIKASVKLEFEGTVYNKVILLEDQYVALTNDKADDVDITLDGDPITIIGRFRGEPQLSKVKTFEVTINGFVAKNNDLKIKTGELEIKHTASYAFFDLEEDNTNSTTHEAIV